MRAKRVFRGDWKILANLLIRQEHKCFYCDRELSEIGPNDFAVPSIDHKTPLCRGGDPYGANIVAACYPCNRAKGPLTAAEFISVRRDPQALRNAVRETHAALDKIRADHPAADGLLRHHQKKIAQASKRRLQESFGPMVRAYRASVAQGDAGTLKTS